MRLTDKTEKIRFISAANILKEPSEELKEQTFASLENLSSVFPEWAKDEQPDLLHFASNLVYVGRKNANGVCLPLDVAKQIYKEFNNKLVDIEHSRKNIVGFITNCVFTTVENNEVIDSSQLDSYEGDVYLTYSGVIWRVAAAKLADLMIDAANPESPRYNAVSSSFELGSNGWDIAIGSEYVKNARIIKAGEPEFEKYKAYLQSSGGSGRLKTGEYVYRNLKLDMVLPLGAGLVASPASQVKGILCLLEEPDEIEIEDDDMEEEDENCEDKKEMDMEDSSKEKNEKKSSESEIATNLSVTQYNPIMKKISKIEDITASLFKEETVASEVTQAIADHIAKSSEDFVKQLNAQKELASKAEKAAADAAALLDAANTKISELEARVSELASQLNVIEEQKASAQAEADFNSRMSAFDAEYDLDEDDRKALVTDIKACKTKEEFDIFAAKMKPLLKEKNKKFKKEKASKMQEKLKAANVTATVDESTLDFKEIVASAQTTTQAALPNTPPQATEPTLLERMQAFKGQVQFNGKSV